MVRGSRGALPAAVAVTLVLLAAAPVGAQITPGVKLRVFETLTRMGDEEWALFAVGNARVSLIGATDSVKAELAVDGVLGSSLTAGLARASVAVRFPAFRLTLGKTALDWGEGMTFNAGDLVFGSATAAGLDLTAATPRDDAAWMAAVYVPAGRFSFAEAVLLPPALDVRGLLEDPPTPLPKPSDLAAGARFVGRLGGIKVEPAYLYRGSTDLHTASLTVQGNLFLDWNLSVSTALPTAEPEAVDLADNLRLTLGLFHLQRLGARTSLSLRAEALVAPGGDWAEVEPPTTPVYGLVLYPEITLSVDQTLSLSVRSLVSPVDASALLVPGVSLSLHKGLSFLLMGSIVIGDDTDTYAWGRPGALSILAGAEYSY